MKTTKLIKMRYLLIIISISIFSKSYCQNNDSIIELPGPKFNTIVNHNSYNLKIKRFITISENQKNNIVLNKKQNFFEPYYSGKPFASGMKDFVYINEGNRISNISPEKYLTYSNSNTEKYYPKNQVLTVPSSIIYYLNDYKSDNDGRFIIDNIKSEQIQKIIKPFYFSKYEVSVKEYKEFINWVLQTNGYNTTPYTIIKIKNVSKTNVNDTLIDIRIKWKENKNLVYKYSFFDSSNVDICVAPLDTIELYYPKENSINNFYDVNPFYYSNYKYSKFPVVGVSYYQALAFLDWKQHFHQKYLDANEANYTIEYSLPNTIEYELVLSDYKNIDNNNWLCDLQLSRNEETTKLDLLLNDKILYNNHLNEHNYENEINAVSLKDIQLTYKNTKKYATRFNHLLSSEIEWLDGNVSEWMADSYTDNWEKAYNLHKNKTNISEADKVTFSIEDFYNKKNNKKGRLVIGGNYLDYRLSMINYYDKEINKAGISLKRFVEPDAQYSTIGFRYVVKVKVKDEARKDSLLRMVGTYNYSAYTDYPYNYGKYFKKFIKDTIKNDVDSVDKWLINIKEYNEILVGTKEVTNGMWRKFIISLIDSGKIEKAKKYIPNDTLWAKYNDNYMYYFKDIKNDKLPVTNISYEAVNEFNKWATSIFNIKDVISDFKLPSEEIWEYFATDKKNKILYPKREFKIPFTANIKTQFDDSLRSYINSNLYKYSTTDSTIINYADLPKTYNTVIYNESYKDVKYKKFLTKYFTYHKYPYTTDNSLPNSNSLQNILGNVAEMIDTVSKVKGGSWNTYYVNAGTDKSEKWNGSPSPFIGFRQVMDLPEKIDSTIFAKIMSRIPPGTVLLTKNFGVDVLEMRNIDYLGFVNAIGRKFGRNSPEYKEVLPDVSVWKSYIVDGVDLSQEYFTNSSFYNNPLVGVSYDQALIYCEWRTQYINKLYRIYHLKYPKSVGVPKRVNYRLPTPEEWDKILTTETIYMPDEGIVTPDFTPPVAKKDNAVNTRISKGLTSSVFYYWRNKIGIYAFDDNVSEMTSEKGVARGCNWTGGVENTNCHYTEPTNWIGFRCVVDVEY